MKINKELAILRELLNITQKELANELNITFETINRWESSKTEIELANLEKVYSFAYKNKIYFNKIYEQLYIETYKDLSIVPLFHGCKNIINFPIDLKHSKPNNDLGAGFYLGETFNQAATYISNSKSNNIYSFILDKRNLLIETLNVSSDWMIAISYYRCWIDNYKDSKIVKKLINKLELADVIIAPIADNRMFDIISEFVRGEITDLQCLHSLSATNLGMQYVIRSEKGLKNLEFKRLFYLSNIEKNDYLQVKLEMSNISIDKVNIAKIEYRGKGKYIDELLK